MRPFGQEVDAMFVSESCPGAGLATSRGSVPMIWGAILCYATLAAASWGLLHVQNI